MQKEISEEERGARTKAMVCKYENGKRIFLSGNAAEEEIERIVKTKGPIEQKVKGLVANKGTISGRARIVLVEDIEKLAEAEKEFQEDDILITTMTAPDMLPLIRKTAGIVTNEGGICSHAAVISREMTTPRKKPCVVGTKNATRIFQTGEYIRIDGETGIIMKIQKEEHEEHIKKLQKQLETGGN